MIEGTLEPEFAGVVHRFEKLFGKPKDGGGALAMFVDGQKVIDVWAGFADASTGRAWERDTVAMSFSTTKGVSSTVAHCLVDQGLISYDEPVATWWPEFAANGKQGITLRDVMTHRAGLHDLRSLVDVPEVLLDPIEMEERLAAAAPKRHPDGRSGYHAFTYGWLIGGIVRRVTNSNLTDQVESLLAKPLGLEGLFIGLPPQERHRNAVLSAFPGRMTSDDLGRRLESRGPLKRLAEALLPNGAEIIVAGREPMMSTEMGSVNGYFDARSLGRMYAMIACDGELDGVRVLTPRTISAFSRKHVHGRDYVVGLPMGWRLGYHQAFTTGKPQKRAFGHFGFGGAGAWCDLDRRISLAFVTNRMASVTTPFADARLARLGGVAIKTIDGAG